MVYEKKLMILSGRGKGVVLIERSGLGVKFALRTFSLPARADYKAGIITPRNVTVRDLPATRDPAAVFFVDDMPLDSLHFAVFDTELRLYGSTSVRMWEANVMDILRRHCAPVQLAVDVVKPQELPPIREMPRVLPMPDGSGIPQSRILPYGDDALAESDFYTPFDLASQMPRLDSFLDSPRVLNDQSSLAEDLAPAPEVTAADGPSITEMPNPSEPIGKNFTVTGASSDAQVIEMENEITESTVPTEDVTEMEDVYNVAQPAQQPETADAAIPDEPEPPRVSFETIEQPPVETTVAEKPAVETVTQTQVETNIETCVAETTVPETPAAEACADEREAAACTDTNHELPWEMTARWLKSRATRAAIERVRPSVPHVAVVSDVPRLREVTFFERLGADIEKLFGSAPRDGELTALLPDIEWVKVPVDSRNSVSVGRSGNAFLCYAVAGNYEKTPPIENAQWLPKLRTAPTGKGYWLVFQDLGKGEIII